MGIQYTLLQEGAYGFIEKEHMDLSLQENPYCC